MSERRRRERVAIPAGTRAIPAEFKAETLSGVGKVVRVGEAGLVLRTAEGLEVPLPIELILYDSADCKIELSGMARRSSECEGQFEIFVELDESTDAYQELFERLVVASPGGVDSLD